ncbi:MAG: cysteine-rich CWC family protein, partial [Burkholderiaceae bacterium]|nr:cysteine-rich CWC family protein [Burkholderiaceae bacterium]
MNPLSKDACPACGQPNQCAMAGGADPQGCWCMQTPVSRAAL